MEMIQTRISFAESTGCLKIILRRKGFLGFLAGHLIVVIPEKPKQEHPSAPTHGKSAQERDGVQESLSRHGVVQVKSRRCSDKSNGSNGCESKEEE